MFCDPVIRERSQPAKASGAEPLAVHTFDRRELLAELKQKGVRLTRQRRAVVEVIQEAADHLDASALLELGRKKCADLDRATVYRTIELLKRHRLIEELDLMHLQGEKHYYEARTRGDHIHLACFRCGRILECATPMLEWLKLELQRSAEFDLRVTRLEVGGYCKECRGR